MSRRRKPMGAVLALTCECGASASEPLYRSDGFPYSEAAERLRKKGWRIHPGEHVRCSKCTR